MGSCEVQQVARCGFLLPRNLIKTYMAFVYVRENGGHLKSVSALPFWKLQFCGAHISAFISKILCNKDC